MSDLGFRAFDADHHYYEHEDAFIRHIDPKLKRRCMQWAEINGRKRLLVGGKLNSFIPNPTFDPVAKPGILDAFFRGKNPEGKSMIALFGELDPINPAYRDRDARVSLVKSQGLDGAFMFPTLAVGMEVALSHDPEAACAAFRAFNRWLVEDWGFSYQDTLFAAPYIPLMDPAWAVEELEWALAQGAKMICMTPGPVVAGAVTRSPGDPIYDPFWARLGEAGITLSIHAGDAGYNRFADEWGVGGDFRAFDYDSLRACLSPAPAADTLAAMVCHGLFTRHPNVRVATIECGSQWVGPLLARLKKAYGQMPFAFEHDPVEQFRRNIWVAPYYEDDLEGLKAAITAEHVLFGSDYPHAEGLAVPTDFIHDCKGYDQDEIRLVMRENAMGLIVPRPASAA
ncbi:MAG: amidohydrolase family protein [Deltaproteobacteria bacterium]|nr:amidohydrolase family protein [Deltaproteobacteria bacterium]MBW2394901.1 amidohydrolase family protein [Deltaproteobacteria bacterium]